MLSRIHRFHGHNSLNWAYRQGKTIRDPRVCLRFAANSRRSSYRVAVVVSRKVSKSAVVRNRIRRRIYETIRVGVGPISANYDLIFSVYASEVGKLAPPELKELIEGLLKQAGVID